MKLILDGIEFTEAPVYRTDGAPIEDAAFASYRGIVVDPTLGDMTLIPSIRILLTNAERRAIEVILKDVPTRVMNAIVGSPKT